MDPDERHSAWRIETPANTVRRPSAAYLWLFGRTTREGMTPNRDHEYVLGPDTDAGRELKAAIQREWRRAIEDST